MTKHEIDNICVRVLKKEEERKYYTEAVQIRIKAFFEGMPNAVELINDKYETKAIHIVCLYNEQKVIGTGRLNVENGLVVISQMAVAKEYQCNLRIGKRILFELINHCKVHNVNRIELCARESAIGFYQKCKFNITGGKHPSIKTGIVHQKMELSLK